LNLILQFVPSYGGEEQIKLTTLPGFIALRDAKSLFLSPSCSFAFNRTQGCVTCPGEKFFSADSADGITLLFSSESMSFGVAGITEAFKVVERVIPLFALFGLLFVVNSQVSFCSSASDALVAVSLEDKQSLACPVWAAPPNRATFPVGIVFSVHSRADCALFGFAALDCEFMGFIACKKARLATLDGFAVALDCCSAVATLSHCNTSLSFPGLSIPNWPGEVP
jgi:hypothetical protein